MATRGLAVAFSSALVVACASAPPEGPVHPAPSVSVSASAPSAPALAGPITAPSAWVCKSGFAVAGPPKSEPYDDGRPKRVIKDACAPTPNNVDAAAKEILASAGVDSGKGRTKPWASWDHKSKPRHLDVIEARHGLLPEEKKRLFDNGFVVLDRATSPSYGWALHDVYQSELPLYVSADAILHAIYIGNDGFLEKLETDWLAPKLALVIASMQCALADVAPSWPRDVARDVDVYLAVAASLLADKTVPPALDGKGEVDKLVDAVKKAEGMSTVTLFGRDRQVDWSSFQPRGHYTHGLEPYFRGAMWLSRLELNLVSRSCRSSQPFGPLDPSETPREAAMAIALHDLAEHAHALSEIDALDDAWAVLAGKREDVGYSALHTLKQSAGITSVADPDLQSKLAKAIGKGFVRTARTHPMPEGASDLPVIASMLGPRIVADSAAMRPLVHTETPDRHVVRAADVAYALGHDRALQYEDGDLTKYPTLRKQLDASRAILQAPLAGHDLYSAWLTGLRSLGALPDVNAPSYFRTDAYRDFRVDTAIAGYAQLRHNFALIAAGSYDEGGCDIPDAYVEPAPKLYEALIEYATRGEAVAAKFDDKDASGQRAYFKKLAHTLSVLKAIGDRELSGEPLTEAQKRFLSMVVEMTPGSTGSAPTYTGWWFDLFRTTEDALAASAVISDFATSAYVGKVSYVGAREVAMGVFVVDVNGAPRAMIGPVARAFEHTGPLSPRIAEPSDPAITPRAPWSASYTVKAPKEPPIAWAADESMPDKGRIDVEGAEGTSVKLSLLDHHHRVKKSITKKLGKKPTRFDFGAAMRWVRISSGTFQRDVEVSWAGVSGATSTYVAPEPK